MAKEISLLELSKAIDQVSDYEFKENVKHFEKLYCDDELNTFHGFSSQSNYAEMLEDVLRVNGGKHHILCAQLRLKIANERLQLEERLRVFLKDVVADKYGETELNNGDVKLFFVNATTNQLKELDEDFFWIYTSRLTDAEDIDLDELLEFIREEVNVGDTITPRY